MREFVQRVRGLAAALTFAFGSSVAPLCVHAQSATRLDLGGAIDVGGEAERYLRAMALSPGVPAGPWTILPFAAGVEAGVLRGPHPWEERFGSSDSTRPVRWLRPSVTTTLNTAFPFQDARGPVWAGRGLTGAVEGGFAAWWGRVHLQLAPIAFIAQNSGFPLAINGDTGIAVFADARFPRRIDYPQRFGDGTYGRVDPGASTLSLELPALTTGVSTAAQRWGPAREYPLLLGPGAGGFPHAFLGTNAPLDLRILQLRARMIFGTLAQSSFSAARAGATQRTASAAVIAVSPAGVEGLELGFARFFEAAGAPTLDRIFRPFSTRALVGAVGDTGANAPRENQLASLFFRWALPSAGFEAYGEWYREDSPGDLRKLILKPDDLSAFTIGLQRVLTSSPSARRVFRLEAVNGELSHQERGQRGFDEPVPPYIHSEVLQGHTNRGLLLGSPEAYGGAGWRIALDDYTERGRRSVGLERALRFDWLPGQPVPATDVHPDVLYAVRFELLRFAGARDYTLIVVPAIDLNRNLVDGANRFNLHTTARVRGW